MSGAALLLGALIGCGAASGEPAGTALLVVEKTSLGGEPEANRRWRVETDGDPTTVEYDPWSQRERGVF